MSKAIQISLDEMRGHLVDPPILDALHFEPDVNGYVITFVPDDYVSPEPKETVTVPADTVEGRQIDALLNALSDVLGDRPARMTHGGGGHFTFTMSDDRAVELADARIDSEQTIQALDRIKSISVCAAVAFRISRMSAA